ncbi:Piso0_002080 [Millerozyma farinosa CBS 7064]|uniref:Carboxypeptidase n=1 Tax=Pichia sorbitophila (strain ATCC MYA-4447 / BCRC 22081 / CBS 7064 / NBRC 10061 / NRRL Y-12695) TaxID=559304 RepID=G8YE25_PICSO|nr:Piso0_002080 [Millerozyma farinosa CBS 7064]
MKFQALSALILGALSVESAIIAESLSSDVSLQMDTCFSSKEGPIKKISVSYKSEPLRKLDQKQRELIDSAWNDINKSYRYNTIKEKLSKYSKHETLRGDSNSVESKFKEQAAFLPGSKLNPSKGKEDKEGEFEVLSNDKFEDYSLRIKKSTPEVLGLDSVNQYTGYLDVNSLGKHFFFWFFESRNDPENDPVILWLNGGPGCSSSTGLLFELGPSGINSTLQPVYNPHSWNSNASVIFLDQPVDVGYSYTEQDAVTNTDDAAVDFYTFLELFFQKFPEFRKNKFHIAGESYAGHYIPRFASEIINRADRSFELTSVLIGNGYTDPKTQDQYIRPMVCGEGGYKQVISDEECKGLERSSKNCERLGAICYNVPTAATCVAADLYCSRLLDPVSKRNINVYDIRRNCTTDLCYDEMEYLSDYLNSDFVKKSVGASESIKFKDCDDQVALNFFFSGDGRKPFTSYVSELLDNDIPVLIYAGDKDIICNWLGNHAWVLDLEYKHSYDFKRTTLAPWKVDGKEAGQVKNYGGFTFLRIYDAGHMVPFDQPENSLAMVNRWINGDYGLNK